MVGFVCGVASICCWLVAQMPQLYRNYKNKSAEALSSWFLAEWLLGDTCNLLGALLKGDQLPTVVFTAQYFIAVDAVMMVQYVYYISLQRRRERMLALRRSRHHHHHRRHHHSTMPQQPVEQQHAANSSGGGHDGEAGASHVAPGGESPDLARGGLQREDAPTGGEIVDGQAAGDESFRPQRMLACLGTMLVVARVDTSLPQLEDTVQQRLGAQRRLLGEGGSDLGARVPARAYTIGTVVGYCSCALYLSSRLSQIRKNQARRSVAGLAMSMFLCAIAANSFYGASILVRSATWPELRSSLPWLVGSLGTVVLDLAIMAQAHAYAAAPTPKHHASDEDDPLLPTP